MGRLQDLFARGVVLASAGAKKMRELQVRLLADEVRDELEHVEPYGFTSEPKDDGKPEAFAFFFDGDRSHGVVFAVADRRFRIRNMKPGEVAIYDDLGQKIYLTRGGIRLETPGTLTGVVGKDTTLTVGGSLSAEVSGPTSVKTPSVEIDAKTVHITGALTVGKLITGAGGLSISGGSGAAVAGDLKTTGDVKAGGISLTGHVHPGDSGGTTGKPQ